MHPDELSPTLFRVGGPALKIWDLMRNSTQDEVMGGGPRSLSEKVVSAGGTLERVGFEWADNEYAVTKKKRSGGTSSRNILYEFECNLDRVVKAIVGLRDLSTSPYPRGRDGRRHSSARRADIHMLREEVGGLSVAIVLILVDYILLLSIDSLVPWITERAALILQNSKLGVNERLDEVNRLVRGEYYRVANPTQSQPRNRSKSARNQPPRAPSPPRFAKGSRFDGYRHNRHPVSDGTSRETSDSSYDDFRGRQRHDGYSATSSTISASEFEEVPDLSYESSEDDAYYYYDDTASATSVSSDFDTLGARVDDRWSCDSWHDMNRREKRSGPYDRHVDNQRGARQQTPGGRERELGRERERDATPPPRFSQTRFFDARNIAGEPRIPRTPQTPQFHQPPPPPHQKGFAPPHVRHPPPPAFNPGPPQRRFSHSFVPMPDAPPRNVRFLDQDGRDVYGSPPRYNPAPPLMQRQSSHQSRPVTMVPGMQIPMPTSFVPGMNMNAPPTPGFVHPRRTPAASGRPIPGPLPRSQTWPPSNVNNRRATYGMSGVI